MRIRNKSITKKTVNDMFDFGELLSDRYFICSDEWLTFTIQDHQGVGGKFRDNMNHLKTIAKISGKPIMIRNFNMENQIKTNQRRWNDGQSTTKGEFIPQPCKAFSGEWVCSRRNWFTCLAQPVIGRGSRDNLAAAILEEYYCDRWNDVWARVDWQIFCK